MNLLEKINCPGNLQDLTNEELPLFASEIRELSDTFVEHGPPNLPSSKCGIDTAAIVESALNVCGSDYADRSMVQSIRSFL